MSARTIKNPATVSGQGNLASDSLTLSNTVNCVLTSNASGNLLANGVPVSGGGGGGVDAVLGGDGISVVTAGGDATVTNDGVLELTAGANITISGTKDNYTIASSGGSGGGIDSVTGGAGISVSGTTDVTVTNDGVLELTAGANITISGTKDNYTIASSGGSGGGIDSVTGGAGISVSGTTDVTVTNDGVLGLTAGSNITISGTKDNYTIASTLTNSNIGGVRFNYTFPIGTVPYQVFNLNNISIPNFIGNGDSAYVMSCNAQFEGPYICVANFNQSTGGNTLLQIAITYIGTTTTTAVANSVNFSVIAYNL